MSYSQASKKSVWELTGHTISSSLGVWVCVRFFPPLGYQLDLPYPNLLGTHSEQKLGFRKVRGTRILCQAEDFCICIYQEYWLVAFLSCIWLWHQGNGGIVMNVEMFLLIQFFLENLRWVGINSFIHFGRIHKWSYLVMNFFLVRVILVLFQSL